MKTKKQILHTTGADGISYKIEVITKTKRHLKESIQEILFDMVAILFLIEIYCLMILCY